MRVGAVEDRRARTLVVARRRAQIPRNVVGGEQGFVSPIGGFVVADLRPALPRRPKILALALDIVRHHRRGCLQNILRGTVVLLQAHNLGLGKIFLKLQNVANVGSPPGVNRLVLIAHGANVVSRPRQQPHKFILRTVGVLIFVDHDVLKTPVVVFADFGSGFQQTHGLKQEIVKIERVRLAQLFAVLLINLSHALGLRIGGLQVDLLGIEHMILGPGNMGQHGARGGLFIVDSQAAHHAFDQLLLIVLVVDHKALGVADGGPAGNRRSNAQGFDIAAQKPYAEGMEG